MNIAYNMDCLEAMKQMPDNAFDLAVVDPPYGDALHADDGGGGGWFKKYRQNDSQIVQVEREPWNRFGGRFDRYKSAPTRQCGSMESAGPAGPGRRGSQKNHFVGHSAEAGIFRGAVSCLTQSDYMGRQLLLTAANAMFSDMAQNQCT